MRILVPLRSAPVALLWGGLSLSAIGDQLYSVALTWIAVGVLGALSGYLSALQAAVALASVLGVGRWVDRWDPRAGMVRADVMRAAALGLIVGAWSITGHITIAELIFAIVVLAIGQSIFVPALQSLLPRLVTDRGLLPATNGLLDGTDRSARLIGPGLVGLLAGVVPIMHFLTIDGLTFVFSAMALVLIGRLKPDLRIASVNTRESVWGSLRRGIRAMKAHPLLRYFLAVTGVINGAWYAAFYLCLPLLLVRGQHSVPGPGGLETFGLTISAYGCTNLASTVFFGGRRLTARPQYQMLLGNCIVGVGILLMAAVSLLPEHLALTGFVIAAVIGGVGGPMKDIPLAVLRQTRLPTVDVAAAMRAYLAANYAGALIAMTIAPSLIKVVGTPQVLAACGLAFIGIAFVGCILHGDWVERAGENVAVERPT